MGVSDEHNAPKLVTLPNVSCLAAADLSTDQLDGVGEARAQYLAFIVVACPREAGVTSARKCLPSEGGVLNSSAELHYWQATSRIPRISQHTVAAAGCRPFDSRNCEGDIAVNRSPIPTISIICVIVDNLSLNACFH